MSALHARSGLARCPVEARPSAQNDGEARCSEAGASTAAVLASVRRARRSLHCPGVAATTVTKVLDVSGNARHLRETAKTPPQNSPASRTTSTTNAMRPFRLAGRTIAPTQVFDTYWQFAAERQRIYMDRIAGKPRPWTEDDILAEHRFTNCYRAADRVSQYLIKNVSYRGEQSPIEIAFRTLLFKFFNKVETWELLEAEFTDLSWTSFDIDAYDQVLSDAMNAGRRLYSAAYVMPSPALGAARKHSNHLRLLATMIESSLPERLAQAPNLAAVYEELLAFPSLGPFLAFQYAIDLNYSTLLNFDEMDFVVAGPGARDGLRKCFGDASVGIEAELIAWVAETQDEHLSRLGITFDGLWGRKLQLIDCQNLFCEVDKYSRVAHPEVAGHSGRTRIKQKYSANGAQGGVWFPPKWGLNEKIAADVNAVQPADVTSIEFVAARSPMSRSARRGKTTSASKPLPVSAATG